jgi:hypothetical protein
MLNFYGKIRLILLANFFAIVRLDVCCRRALATNPIGKEQVWHLLRDEWDERINIFNNSAEITPLQLLFPR